MIKSLKILFLLSSCSWAYAAEYTAKDTAIYNAHVVSANSLNKAALIAHNLKNVSEQRDKDNLIRILINLNLTLAAINKELANQQPNITNLEKKTDEAKRLSKLGTAILKIGINATPPEQRRARNEAISQSQEDNSNESETSSNVMTGRGLQQILQEVISELPQPVAKEESDRTEAKNGYGLQQILQNVVSNVTKPTAEEALPQATENEEPAEELLSNSGTGLQQILKNIVSVNFDSPSATSSASSPTHSTPSTEMNDLVSPGLRGILEVLARNMESKEKAQKTTRPGSGLRRILQSIVSKEYPSKTDSAA